MALSFLSFSALESDLCCLVSNTFAAGKIPTLRQLDLLSFKRSKLIAQGSCQLGSRDGLQDKKRQTSGSERRGKSRPLWGLVE